MREVLQLPAYRRLLIAYALTELAWSVGSLALAVLVYRRTGSAAGATAFFLSAQFVPALLAPACVARLDRGLPRRVLPALYALEGLLFGVLAWLASHFSLGPVLVLAALDGLAALVARSLARAATVAVTSPANLLREGNALANTVFSVSMFAGPAIGGAVVAADGTAAALLVNMALFAVIAVTLATARTLTRPDLEDSQSHGRLAAALRHARQVPAIRILLGLQAAALVFFTMSVPVEVVFAQRTLHAGAAGYGALLAVWGGGAVAGSAIYARWRALSPRALIAVGAGALGGGFVLMAAAPSLAVALVGAAIGGTGNGVEAVAARTALQEEVSLRWMAVINSLNDSLYQAMPGVGMLLGGAITELANPRAALAVAGAGSLAVTVAILFMLRPSAGVLGGRAASVVDEPPPVAPLTIAGQRRAGGEKGHPPGG